MPGLYRPPYTVPCDGCGGRAVYAVIGLPHPGGSSVCEMCFVLAVEERGGLSLVDPEPVGALSTADYAGALSEPHG